MRAGSLDLNSDTGERLDPAPPFGGAHNVDWEAREFLPVPQDGTPVPGAEEVATVDEDVAEEHPVARVGQAPENAGRKRSHARLLRLDKGREVLHCLEDRSSVLPEFLEPGVESRELSSVARADDLEVRIRRDHELPHPALAGQPEVVQRFQFRGLAPIQVRARRAVLNLIGVVEHEVQDAGVKVRSRGKRAVGNVSVMNDNARGPLVRVVASRRLLDGRILSVEGRRLVRNDPALEPDYGCGGGAEAGQIKHAGEQSARVQIPDVLGARQGV